MANAENVQVDRAVDAEARRVRDMLAIALKATAARLAGPGVPVRADDYAKALEQLRGRDFAEVIKDTEQASTRQLVEKTIFPKSDIICRFKYHVVRLAYGITLAASGKHLSCDAFERALPRAFQEACLVDPEQMPDPSEELV
jgi:hypothetical protein